MAAASSGQLWLWARHLLVFFHKAGWDAAYVDVVTIVARVLGPERPQNTPFQLRLVADSRETSRHIPQPVGDTVVGKKLPGL